MPGNTESYRNPPIVEAILDVRFAESREMPLEQMIESLEGALRSDYPGGGRQMLGDVQVTVPSVPQGGQPGKGTISRKPRRILLVSEDGSRKVGVGERSLSVHLLRPYSGWKELKRRFRSAIDAYLPIAVPMRLTQVGIRYVDHVVLREAEIHLPDYLTIAPPGTESMPEILSGFHMRTRSFDPGEQVQMELTVASLPEPSGRLVVLFDIQLTKHLDTEAMGGWVAPADQLHDLQRNIFEESITEKTRELFR